MGTRRVHFVRHGQCVFNAQGRLAGQLDPPLTPLGVTQAEAAAALLSLSEAGFLFSSDLQRARDTAELIGRRLGLPVHLDAALREQRLGDMEGKRSRDLRGLEVPPGQHINTIRWGGGESMADVFARVERFLGTLSALPPGPVIIVSHGHTIHAALAVVADTGPLDIEWIDLPNGGIVTKTLRS